MAIESATTLYHLLKGRAERAPHDIAAAAPEGSPLTYAQLLSQVHYVGKTLNSIGIGRNDVVAIVLPNGPEIAAAFLSVAANASCAPLNPSFSPGEFDFHLSAMKAKVLIVKTGMASRAAAAAQKQSIPIIEWSSVLDPATGLFLLMCDQPRHKTPGGFADAEDVALILSTSGTTSRPKLVPLSHSNLLASARNIARTLELTAKDRCLNVMPLFHVHGLVGALLSSIAAGSSVVCASTFDPERFLAWLETSRPTWYTAVPAMHRAILSSALSHKEILRRVPLRFIRSCSAALPVEVMQELENVFNVPVIEAYGMTEAAHQIASNPFPPRTRKAGSVGLPSGVEVAVMDDEGNIVTSHQTGEIAIRGPTVLTGYAENAVANEQSFRRGWFRTGDQGYLDADGYLFLMGRFDETINHGGEKVSPVEVDEVLAEHPAVSTAVTFPIPHSTLGQEIAAALVLRRGASVTEAEIQRFAATRLAHFKIPRRVLVVSTIPQTATGKIQRNRLAEKFGFVSRDGKITGAKPDLAVPRTQTERALASIWSLVLGVDVGIHDNFFHLGGDSIHIARIISRVRAAMGTELSVLSFFDTPTVAGMARTIDTVARESKSPEAALLQSVPRQEELPLSFAQQRLWFFEQLEPGNPAYNRPVALRLTGQLQAQVLERCLSEIVHRHEVLRANFRTDGGQPTQVISPHLKLDLTIIDLSHLQDSERKAETLRQAVNESRQAFDLAHGALFRTRLYRLGDEEHLLLIVTHHSVFDGWSENVLLNEIAALYSSLLKEEPPSLPDLTVQYADYALWQQKQFQGDAWEKDFTYWKRSLNKPFPPLNLPTDRPRAAVQTYRGARRTFTLPVSLAEQLRELSCGEQVTLFMTLLAAFKTLLYRYTGQEDISVGVPTAGRNRVETEPLVGVFINTLVLRTDLSGDPSFRELLRRTRNAAVEAYRHQDLPFEKLIEVSRVERDLSRHPLFDVMFQQRSLPKLPVTMPGLEIDSIDLDIGTAKFDLTLEIVDRSDALECRFEYNTDLFNADTILRMGGHYQTLLEGIIANPEQRLFALPLLTRYEKHQLLTEWNGTERDFPKQKCIHQLFEEQVERSPDAIAVVFEEQQLTYRELNQRANQLARYLRKFGAGPEALVGLCIERSLDMIVGLLGILKAGGAYVPLDPEYPKERLAFMLEDTQPPVLLTRRRLLNRVPDYAGQRICLDEDWDKIAQENEANFESGATAHNLAYVIYTSGSTGTPKGVLVEHQGLCNLTDEQVQRFRVNPADRVLQFASLSFDASIFEIALALRAGARLYLCTLEALLVGSESKDFLSHHEITIAHLPPSVLATIPPAELPALTLVCVGGEACSAQLVRQWASGRRFFNLYGPTEATVWATIASCDSDDERVYIGQPIANSQIYILDAHQELVPTGVPGELSIGGVGVARGYLNRPELTAEKFVPNPFAGDPGARLYRTGDLARYRVDGRIEFLGRIDQQVKIRGFRIELREIESALRQHPAVRESVVAAREDVDGDASVRRATGKRLVAYVVGKTDRFPSINELRNFLKTKLPEHMIPAAFVFLGSLPLTANGKVDRKALPAPDQRRPELEEAFVAPRTIIEEIVAHIWSDVLQLEKIGIHDNFFALGAHSLLATQMIARIRQLLGTELPLRAVFEATTVEKMTVMIIQEQSKQSNQEDVAAILSEVESLTDKAAERLSAQARK